MTSLTTKIMLWGIEKATSKMLREMEDQNNNPKSVIRQKIKKEEKSSIKQVNTSIKPSKKEEKRFDPDEDYGVQDLALAELKKIIDSNPRDLQSLEIVALIHERLGNNYEVIKYRTQITGLDPWNAQNYLRLGKIYRNIRDYESMNRMLFKIQSFAAGTEISESANKELLD